jgi:Photoprotection regulator fluorescence recovery protein
MLEASKNQFSEMEEAIAQQALQKAYERETSALINHVRDRANSINKLEDLWYLHDLLSTKRYEIDGKYAYNFSTIVFDFAGLVKEKWLYIDDLQGLKPEILSKISALARM